MRTILSFLLVSLALPAFASDESVFLCVPTRAANGLGISSISLHISNEDPDATMKVQYENGRKTTNSNMSYEGGRHSYRLTPYSKQDGDLSVTLVKQQNGPKGWTAYVSHEYLDTRSQLACTQWL